MIIDYIPYGHDNGISVSELCRRTGLTNREVRKEIHEARKENPVINLQDGKGYFRPDYDEDSLVAQWITQETSRFVNTIVAVKSARRLVKASEIEQTIKSFNEAIGGI